VTWMAMRSIETEVRLMDMNAFNLDEYAFAGWFIVHPLPRPEGALPELSPHFVTASECQALLLPDVWAFGWSEPDRCQAAAKASMLGLSPAALSKVTRLVNDAHHAGQLAWPHYVLEIEVARALYQCLPDGSDALVIGTGLARTDVESLLAVYEGKHEFSPNLAEQLAARARFPGGGRTLGFELLVCDEYGASGHSWICNGLDSELWLDRRAKTNALGLLDDATLAREWAATIMSEDLGEPGLWLPWLLVDYTDAFR